MGAKCVQILRNIIIKHSDSKYYSSIMDWKNESNQLKTTFHREVHMTNGFCFNSYSTLSNLKETLNHTSQ